jgi:hypothetical protein
MKAPNATKNKILSGQIDLANDTIKVLALKNTTAYTFDKDNHDFVQDVLNNGDEFDDTNYSRLTLANQATSTDDTDDEGVFDADDITWQDLGGSQDIQTVIIYKQVGGDDTTPGDDPVIAVLDDDTASDLPFATNGSNVTVTWDGQGIAQLA